MRIALIAPAQQDYVSRLFTKYRESLHRYLARLVGIEEAADLVQETYYRLLRRGGTIELDFMARALLFHTATNLARDHLRRRRARRASHHVRIDDYDLAQDHLGPDTLLISDQTQLLVERTIASLASDTRTVLLLHSIRELSYPQIAATLQVSTRTVARKMEEARSRLIERALVGNFRP